MGDGKAGVAHTVPAILTRTVTCTSGFETEELLNRGGKRCQFLDAHVGNKGQADVGVVVVGDQRSSVLFLLGNFNLGLGGVVEEVSGLCNLLLGKVVGQGPCEMIRLCGIESGLLGIQVAARETDIEVAPEGAVVLNRLGDRKCLLRHALVRVVVELKIFLNEDDIFLGDLRYRGRVERGGEGDDDIEVGVLGPDWGDPLGDWAVRRTLVELLGPKFERWDVVDVSGNLDDLAGLRVGSIDAGLILPVQIVDAEVDTKVDGAAEEKLVEGYSLRQKHCQSRRLSGHGFDPGALRRLTPPPPCGCSPG